ncbi:MAG TPA: biotin--[acetyl-CoA-carboxylase] ligase [Vicinamibacteria bacterium]|nr:biotin--[acetyl-CoA-carboxylase] ligase [Vicinamibacteria bacterium]
MSDSLARLLQRRGIDWPAPVERFASVASTNDVVRERARAGASSWHAVIADRQTAGRGRHGRPWLSEAGDLFLSVLLRPGDVPAETEPVLPLLAGVAASEAAAELGVVARLKWPNDLVAGERKLGGILVEAASVGLGVEHAAVGVGLNLRLDPPEELRDSATSVLRETGRAPSVDEAAAAVLAGLLQAARGVASRGRAAVVAAWRARAADWWGREVEVSSGGARVAGRALGVDDAGALLLESGSGTIRVLSGEARALRLAGGRPEGGE